MSAKRTERLLNLIICLLSTRRWLSREQIRAAVPQYESCESDEAFERMFERDKDDLRSLGIPLIMGSNSAYFEDESGYRIDRDAYAMADIRLNAQELAVVQVAARLWNEATLANSAHTALAKMQAISEPSRGMGEADDAEDSEAQAPVSMAGALEGLVRTSEPSFEKLYAATRDRCPVEFDYRNSQGSSARRHVQPWVLRFRQGRWYLLGFDTDRSAARLFRLSRVTSPVTVANQSNSYDIPQNVQEHELWRGTDTEPERMAQILVTPNKAHGLRARARRAQIDLRDTPLPNTDLELLHVPFADTSVLAQEVLSYGPDALVLEPEDLQLQVMSALQEALA